MSDIRNESLQSAAKSRAFVMLNATICEPDENEDEYIGYYDHETQTWRGRIRIGCGSYSSRSNGSSGGYSYQADD